MLLPNREYAADEHAGRYNKHLFGGTKHAPSHSAVLSAASAARQIHYDNTLPWNDEGWRLLPTSNYFVYQEQMREVRERFERAVRTFIEDYPNLKRQAETLLNGLYRESDYPSAGTLQSRFKMAVDFSPVPTSGDFRLDLPAEQMADIERTVEARVAAATKIAMQDAWRRLYEVVEKYHERLSNPKPINRARLVRAGLEIVEVLKRLNVTDDPDLEKMRQRVEGELTVHEAVDLKQDEKLKKATAKKAGDIMKAMAAFYTPDEEEA